MSKPEANTHTRRANKRAFVIIVLLLATAGCARHAHQSPPVASVMPPSRVSAENVDAAEPSIAAGRDGTAYIVWIEHGANKQADVLVARLDVEGRLTGAPVRVNPKAGEAKGWRGDPPTIAVAPDKTVYVGWTARAAEKGPATTLYLSASRDEGRTFDAPVKVNDDEKPASHGMHSLAVSADNRVYVAWLDERNVPPLPEHLPGANQKTMEHAEPNSELFFAHSADGGRTFSANKRLAGEACPCCKTALVAGRGNQVYASWRQVLPGDFRHIAVASSTDGGQTFAQPQVISDDKWKITGCPVSGPALAVANDGALRAVWYTAGEGGSAGLYWAESRDEGRTFGERKLLAAGQVRGNPSLLLDEQYNLFAVWESDEEKEPRILSSRLAANSIAAATSTTLADHAELPAIAKGGEQLFVGYIVSNKDQRSIWVARAKAAV
ncbi:MAG: exo-alpha-sialidase [Pyrinomonadaceae bacterium]|nr:exo-alpha-sialidase [Pyrinomonadaceae bacterium]